MTHAQTGVARNSRHKRANAQKIGESLFAHQAKEEKAGIAAFAKPVARMPKNGLPKTATGNFAKTRKEIGSMHLNLVRLTMKSMSASLKTRSNTGMPRDAISTVTTIFPIRNAHGI